MSERPSTTLRNQRKHFVKCVDCGRQTLPPNALGESWGAATALRVSGRLNEGALCFQCANNRRLSLGLPLEKEADNETVKTAEIRPSSAASPKRIRINQREYTWNVSTLDSLLTKWREQQFYAEYKNVDAGWALVVVNNRPVSPASFSSVPIVDGDEIFIVLGHGSHH